MSKYTTYTSDPAMYKDEYSGVLVNVDIAVQCPVGFVVDQNVIDAAVERAVDYILDEGIEDE